MPSTPELRIQELGLVLPPAPTPVAKYRPAILVGSLLHVSGHIPQKQAGVAPPLGRVGVDLDVAQGKAAARLTGLAVLSTVRRVLGSLDRVKQLVKTVGLVNCAAEFTEHPQVINGFSELMAEVFGDDAGVGARSAFGAVSLPLNAAVEIECVFEVA